MGRVQPAEPVAAHIRHPGPPASVHVLAVQDPQRHAHTRQLPVHPGPIGPPVHALTPAPAREQERVHLVIRPVGDIIPADAGRLRGAGRPTLCPAIPSDPAIARPDRPCPSRRRTALALILLTMSAAPFTTRAPHGERSLTTGGPERQ